MLVECVIMYYMGYAPADQLLISATEGLIERWATRRLEPAIDSYNYRKDIYAQYASNNSRRTGDKVYSKEYHGCRLDMASAQAASMLRSTDKRIVYIDEVDGAPIQLTTGEGNFVDVALARLFAWGDRGKMFMLSTPTTYNESTIYKHFLEGDQRIFLIPCPRCGEKQALDSIEDGIETEFKMQPVREAGVITSAYFECIKCKEPIWEHEKQDFLKKGFWHPTAVASRKEIASRHWPGVLAPLGMLSWKKIYQKYEKAQKSPDGMRSFNNLIRGVPYKEKGGRPKLEIVLENVGAYKSGSVPKGVLFLTMAVDVQEGNENDSSNPPRLELEICGHGKGYRTWSILYKKFIGATDDPHSGAWGKLNKWAIEDGLTYKRKDGHEFKVAVIFIDSGDQTSVVYQFCRLWDNTWPTKGHQQLKRRKNEGYDDESRSDLMRYRVSKGNDGGKIITISTNYYKKSVYNSLEIKRQHINDNPNGFSDFPIDYPEKYFHGLTVEEKMQDGSFYCKSGARNEPLDCRVGNLCAGDFYLDSLVSEYRTYAKQQGATQAELQDLNHKFVLDKLEAETNQ